MPIIHNLTQRPVLLTLSSGATLHLAPNASSPQLNATEVKNNPKIDKLKSQFVIAVDDENTSSASEGEESKPEGKTSKPPQKKTVSHAEKPSAE